MTIYVMAMNAEIECKDDAEAKRAQADMQKLLENPMVRGMLASKGIQLKAPLKVGNPVKK